MTATRLQMSGVCKRFGATAALIDAELNVEAGEVHALLGENGAGKSTLMKVLSGAVRPDAGSIALDGRPFTPADPLAARRAGVAVVYQELNLAPHLTVLQNLTLGVEFHVAGWIRSRAARPRARHVLDRLNRPDIDLDAPVRQLSSAARQIVEIARALMTDARVLVLDEPTSSLGSSDIEHWYDVVRRLRDTGVGIVYISHFLEEVQRVADRFTVLRDGRNAGSGAIAGTSIEQLVELMIGRRLTEMFPSAAHEVGTPLLEIRGLSGRRLPDDVTFTLHRGEILGIAGLVGAGRTELLRAIFGLDTVRNGKVRFAGELFAPPQSPSRNLARGVGLLSEDRAHEGLALQCSISENLLLSRLSPYARGGWLNGRALAHAAEEWMRRIGVRARSQQQRAGELSGGNQQKVAIARLLHHDVDALLLDEPTRGIDVASKAQIYRLIGELALRGKSVLVVSSYVPELIGICDRIAVMHRGRIVTIRPAREWTEHEVVAVAIGGRSAA